MKYFLKFTQYELKARCKMKIVFLLYYILTVFITAFIPTDAAIADTIRNDNKPVLRVVFSDDLKPWIFNNNGIIEGTYPAIILELAKELNFKADLVQYPLKRCESIMATGEADLIIGLKDTKERGKYIKFFKIPYRTSSAKVFYMRNGEKHKLKRFEDLYQLRVGTKLGTKYFSGFDENKNISKEDVNNEEQNFYKLLAHRIDAIIIPEDRGEFLISILNLRDKVEKASYQYPDGSPRYIGMSKKSPFIKDIKKFNSAMKKIAENGTLESLYMKHFFNKYSIRTDSFRWRR